MLTRLLAWLTTPAAPQPVSVTKPKAPVAPRTVRDVPLRERCQHVGGWSNHLHLCLRSDTPHLDHSCYCGGWSWHDREGQTITEWRRNPDPRFKEERARLHALQNPAPTKDPS